MNWMHDMKCPGCGQDDGEVLVQALVWVALTDDGTEPESDAAKMCGDTEFDDDSDTRCPACDYAGPLREWYSDRLQPGALCICGHRRDMHSIGTTPEGCGVPDCDCCEFMAEY